IQIGPIGQVAQEPTRQRLLGFKTRLRQVRREAGITQTQNKLIILVLYDEAAWNEVVKKARSRAKIDLILLQRRWAGQSCAAPETGGIVRDLSVGSVVLCRPTTWGRSLTS